MNGLQQYIIKCPRWFYLVYLVWGLFSLLDQWVYSLIKFGKLSSIIKKFFFYLSLILNLQITYFTWFDIILHDTNFYSYFSHSTSIWMVNCYVLNSQFFLFCNVLSLVKLIQTIFHSRYCILLLEAPFAYFFSTLFLCLSRYIYSRGLKTLSAN